MKKLRIFVSSVQKELEVERVALAGWVSADPQLSECCDVGLLERFGKGRGVHYVIKTE